MRVANLILFALSALTPLAYADTIYLVDGGKLEGTVTIKNGKAHIELATGRGTLAISEVQILRVEAKKTPLDEFKERFAKLQQNGKATPADYIALGEWTESRGLTLQARDAYREALARDLYNETARKKLGYQYYEGKWLTADEVAQAKGLQRYKGQWLTSDQVAALLQQELQVEQEKARAVAERQAAERQKAEAAAERARADAAAQARAAAEYNARAANTYCTPRYSGSFLGHYYTPYPRTIIYPQLYSGYTPNCHAPNYVYNSCNGYLRSNCGTPGYYYDGFAHYYNYPTSGYRVYVHNHNPGYTKPCR